MFMPLPPGFPALEAIAKMADGSIPPPPDLSSIGEKVYRTCKGLSAAQMPDVRASTRRRIPYAMWLDAQRDINTEAGVVGWYYSNLRDLEINGTSRTKRSLAPLFHTYVARFNPADPYFIRLADNLKDVAQRCLQKDSAVLRLSALHTQFNFFEPKIVGSRVAEAVLSSPHPAGVDGWFESIGLWSGFKASALGMHFFASALQLSAMTFRDSQAIGQLMAWTRAIGGKALSADLKAQLANALLKPWLNADPSEELKRSIGDFCVQILGDPRFEGFGWAKVDPAAKAILLRWLTGRTLDAFFDVLRQTADSIWAYRQEFWAAYFRAGHIVDAWAVLGPDAHRYVRSRYSSGAAELSYGLLTGKADQRQSVLLIKIGDFLFCEWSHNGKLRAAPADDQPCPEMHRRGFYSASELWFPSRPFVSPKTGSFHDDGLPHLSSDSDWWQDTARAFIRKYIGARV